MALARRQLSSAADEPLGPHVGDAADKTPVLQVVTWVLIVITTITVVGQLSSSRRSFLETRRNDAISAATLVFSIAQAIAVSLQNHNGFGKHLDALTPSQADHALKAQYAAEVLYVLAICSSKLSLTSFIWDLSPARSHARATLGIAVLIAAWTLVSLFAVAFRCSPPRTWDLVDGSCINTAAFWTFYGVLSIVVDAALIVFPITIVAGLRLATRARRVNISAYFGLRIFAIAATIVQIVYWNKFLPRADITFDHWPLIVTSQVVLTVSVLVSALPMLGPLMAALESGMVRIDDLRRQDRQHSYTNTGYFTSRKGAKSQAESAVSFDPATYRGASLGTTARKPSIAMVPLRVDGSDSPSDL